MTVHVSFYAFCLLPFWLSALISELSFGVGFVYFFLFHMSYS